MTPHRGMQAALLGLAVNVLLGTVKLTAGIWGGSYALVADALESLTDVFSSLIVWGGLRVAAQPADDRYPYGHGKAEALAAAVVALVLFAAGGTIGYFAFREIAEPRGAPEPFTLVVLALVVVVKELMFRRVIRLGDDLGSTAVQADAWHHRADAATSFAACIGIALAVWGGPGWESADAWAALAAMLVIFYGGVRLLVPAVHDLMDRTADPQVLEQIAAASLGVAEVRAIEKLRVRKFGVDYFVDLHVQADPAMSLHDAHQLSGRVKGAIRAAVPAVKEALIHMEPFE